MDDTKIEDLDLYELLNVNINSTTAEIKKAYRKKALDCHPDKNPDNPHAAKEFHQLSKILEILIDDAARSAYNRVLKGRREAALRNRELDSKRRKLKEDLETREKLAGKKLNKKTANQELYEEIERLRKEGSKQVEEEVEYVLSQLGKQHQDQDIMEDDGKYRIKIKWNTLKNNESSDCGYTEDILFKFLSKYGDITALVISQKKKGRALVEFKTKHSAQMAVEMEIGLPENPLKLEWVNEPSKSNFKGQNTLVKESDYESLVLTRMRQAEERKRLIEQLKAEDEL